LAQVLPYPGAQIGLLPAVSEGQQPWP